MCGVFGFVSGGTKGPDLGRLRVIAEATEARGPDAFGFAWVDQYGSLRMFKQTGRITSHLGLLTLLRGARMVIGHCRYTTRGSHHDNQNNHPHPVNGGWLVHNGKILDYDDLIADLELYPVTGCDSEVLGLMAELYQGDDRERLVNAVKTTASPDLVTLALWSRPRRLVAVRRGDRPLHTGVVGKNVYLASLAYGLPGRVAAVPDGTVVEFRPNGVRYEEL